MNPQAGTLGKYQLIREIARSNDIVYEAYDPAMNRRVALKELSMPGGATEKQRQERFARFQREAKAAGSLSHPNIVTIYEVGQDNGRAFIAMEYLEGQNLRQKLDVVGSLPQGEAASIMLDVLKGLQYAHEHGVVHRDIKPDNIQLLPDGRVKITDFGIARLMFEPNLTLDGQIFGTPSYMSPEQVVGREIDARTDIWGCGVVLYESVAGQKPFVGDSVVTISHAILHSEPHDAAHANYALAQVIRKSIDKLPDNRYPTATAMHDAIKQALESQQTAPVSQPTVYATAQPIQWAAPLDPYAPGGPYQGHPYGQPYGGGQPNMPPIQLPPGWTNPPPRKPLLSPEASEFVRRTLIVIVVGCIVLALGFYGISSLTNAGRGVADAKYDTNMAQMMIDDASALRQRAVNSSDRDERLRLLGDAASKAEKAFERVPDGSSRQTIAADAASIFIDLGAEELQNGLLDSARVTATNAARFAAASKRLDLQQRAAALLNDLRKP